MLHVASNKKLLVQQKKERKRKNIRKMYTYSPRDVNISWCPPPLPLLSPAPQPDLRPSFMSVQLQRGIGDQPLLALSLCGVGGVGDSHRCGFRTRC